MSTDGKGEGMKGGAGKGPGNEVGGRRAGCRAAGWEPGGSSAQRGRKETGNQKHEQPNQALRTTVGAEQGSNNVVGKYSSSIIKPRINS